MTLNLSRNQQKISFKNYQKKSWKTSFWREIKGWSFLLYLKSQSLRRTEKKSKEMWSSCEYSKLIKREKKKSLVDLDRRICGKNKNKTKKIVWEFFLLKFELRSWKSEVNNRITNMSGFLIQFQRIKNLEELRLILII